MAAKDHDDCELNASLNVNSVMSGEGGELEHYKASVDILTLLTQDQSPRIMETEENDLMLDNETEEELEIENIELSPGGILDEETIGRGLSNLGRSANGMHQVYLHLTVPGFQLIDINILQEYTHLQKVELPHNQLTDLSVLSNCPHLLILDVSHNLLDSVLGFEPPKNLQEVDLSYNEIEVMTDLSAHHSLKKLNLSYNKISEIDGLTQCRRLTELNLSHNNIAKIQGLSELPIQHLNLSHNNITKIENIESLKLLRVLDLSGNKVRSLKGLEEHDVLESVDLESNEVIDLIEIKYLQNLRMMRKLNLQHNPIEELPNYRLCILFRLQSLTELDRHKVEVEEKVASKNMFEPPPEVVAARDHAMHVVYSFLQPARILESTLPSKETPYPMLVIVGPQGSGKKDLALKLVEEFSDFFGFGISHTTRIPYSGEVNGVDYHFTTLEKFENDIKLGKFVETHQINGAWYGLQMESIQNVAREGQACVVHMELEGVLTLKNTHFEPRYVLMVPMNKEAHEKRLRDRGIYPENQILDTVKTGDVYSNYNQNHPGFFDMMINSENIQEAYIRLRQLVMNYLGISSLSPSTEVAGETSSRLEAIDHFPPPTTTSTANLITRSWSRPSISETQSIRAQQSSASRGIVEEESLKRRQSAAKDVVVGYIPPLYEQLLEKCPRTAPQTVESQLGLGDDGQRACSAPANNIPVRKGPPRMDSPDSSESNITSSHLSDLDSATDLHADRSPYDTTRAVEPIIGPLDLIEEGYRLSSSTRLNAPRPPSASRPDSQSSQLLNRPGSERHMVLPPIQPVN
ncbi:hypothetical protein SNE40_012111 [Patella caerulea]|uniref:Guanylate kinase-like domain-containing protein n=1 Tax=Patella caerulea TaxID=87958 RepID=A0AAN8PKZ7_PATCE